MADEEEERGGGKGGGGEGEKSSLPAFEAGFALPREVVVLVPGLVSLSSILRLILLARSSEFAASACVRASKASLRR